MLGRSFMEDSDPAPTVATIKSTLKIYPYAPGGPGTSVGTLLQGESRSPAPPDGARAPRSWRGRGLAFNTIPPTDAGFFETVHALLQDEPADAGDPGDHRATSPSSASSRASRSRPTTGCGGSSTTPPTVGNATSRALMFDSRGEEDVAYYPDSAWTNMLFGGGYLFDRPIPMVTPEGIKPFPPTGARKHDLRTLFFYGYTGITPAMAMRLTGIGSQYLVAFMDSNKEFFDGAQVVHGHAAPRHPPSPVLVAHALRQPDPLDARHAPTLPPGREPVVPHPCRGRERRRLDHDPRRPRAAGRRRRRQLDPDRRRARDASPSSGSTARSRRSSTSPGGSASSNPSREIRGT